MPSPTFNPLLNVPAFPANRYAPLADRLKQLMGTDNDLVFVQAEAILALEAAATSLARPGLVALNIATSPYGGYFGGWLRRADAQVHELTAEAGRPVTLEAVKAALEALPELDLVSLVHAETSSGILNPLPAIAEMVRARAALLVVDAVASFGGHPLDVDELGIDLCVVGAQKAIGGPAGLSMLSVSQRAWAAIAKSPTHSPSSLALQDLKINWLDRGRGVVPGMPSAMEFWALEAAVDRIEAEGMAAVIARHELAGRASRAALVAMGVTPWVEDERQASTLATAAPIPDGVEPEALIAAAAEFGVGLSPGFGEVRSKLVRLDHTGARASFAPVLANVAAYAAALVKLGQEVDVGAGAAAAVAAYSR